MDYKQPRFLTQHAHVLFMNAYLMHKHRCGRRSWRPWWVSLAVDLLSGHFSRRGRTLLQRSTAGGMGVAGREANRREQSHTSLLSVALVRCDAPAVFFPFFVNLLLTPTSKKMHVCARCDQSNAFLSRRGLSTQQWSLGEVQELSERRRRLIMYALRSPFFNSFVRSVGSCHPSGCCCLSVLCRI